MSALAYVIRLLRILLAAGLFATVLFGEASRSQAAICLPSTVKERRDGTS